MAENSLEGRPVLLKVDATHAA